MNTTQRLDIITDELAYLLGKQSMKARRAYDPATQARIAALREQQKQLTKPN